MRHLVHVEGRVWRRRDQDGNRYYYRRRLPVTNEGKRRYRDVRKALGSNLERALQLAKTLDAEKQAELNGEKPRRQATLGELSDAFIGYIRDVRRLAGWNRVRSNIVLFLRHTGDMALERVSRITVEDFLMRRRQEVRPSSANSALRDVKRLFSFAVNQGSLEKNPAAGVRALHAPRLPRRLPTSLEVERLLKACPDWLRRIILTLASTGARVGEVIRLDWSDIDFTAHSGHRERSFRSS